MRTEYLKRFFAFMAAAVMLVPAIARDRWQIVPGGKAVRMEAEGNCPHEDHIEMSGEKVSVVLYWGLDSDKTFHLTKSLVFPMLRTVPNDTHASLMLKNTMDITSSVLADGYPLEVVTDNVEIDGTFRVHGTFARKTSRRSTSLKVTRTVFPSRKSAAVIERYTISNTGDSPCTIMIPNVRQEYATDPAKGVKGSYIVEAKVHGSGIYTIEKGKSLDFGLVTQAYEKDGGSPAGLDVDAEYVSRLDLISLLDENLVLDTPDSVINTEFRFAKIRGCESIYNTKGGYLHSPGGESYYAAIWANDQAEYINPFFPFTGYDLGNEAARNSYSMFARYMNDGYEPIPSSIIAEGDDFWNGAGDRGDAAMIAYGASRFALESGDRQVAQDLWPLIEWTLEYCRKKLNANGVVTSDSDELEGRFPSGEANLCTSSLYYDALVSAAYLAGDLGLGIGKKAAYLRQSRKLAKAIEGYFGSDVQGYRTYRYYEGNDILRSWICIPLTVGIFDRAEGTMDALFKSGMYTEDGLLTAQGSTTFWDRSTLYAFRGGFYAGYPDFISQQLSAYSRRRLLSDHVPYPIEAWPEGSQRHLSAESGLYCRIITEGLFGIRPSGLHEFELKVELPSEWDHAFLRHVRAFGGDFDIEVHRADANGVTVNIIDHRNGKVENCGYIAAHEKFTVRLQPRF